MTYNTQDKKRILIAQGKLEPELVIKNANIINVFTKEIVSGDIAIDNKVIVGVGKYNGKEEINANNKYVCPGLIDSHVHIESTMVTPSGFAKTVLPFGTTTVIADPHEIANVSGLEGIEYMMELSKNLPINIYFMLPSCVPATSFENNGATLNASDLSKLINHPSVLGLGEVMDYPAVLSANKDVLDKISISKHKVVDGHSPKLTGKYLNAYKVAGVDTDHECSLASEAIERLRLGMYVQLREGSAAKNLEDILSGLIKSNISLEHCIFCTDDRHLDDIVSHGHIDNMIRKSIELGLNPIDAISMATINAAKCYNLKTKGAIAPLYDADLLILDNLEEFKVSDVIVGGKLVVSNSKLNESMFNLDKSKYNVNNSINMPIISREMFEVNTNNKEVNVIKVISGQIETTLESKVITDKDNICKIAVIERHKNTGNIGLGYLEGLGFKNGAIAQSIAHDSHNVIVVGDNDNDMAIAANHIKSIHGGIVIVSNGDIVHHIELPIAGLMSNKDHNYIIDNIKKLNNIARKMGVPDDVDPFLTLSFMSLPVIPSVRITDQGLFDVEKFDFINLTNE